MRQTCNCFDCACLGSCLKASAKVKHCAHFIESKLSSKDAAHILGCSKETLIELKKEKTGIAYLLKKFKQAGYLVMVDFNGKGVSLYRKVYLDKTAIDVPISSTEKSEYKTIAVRR